MSLANELAAKIPNTTVEDRVLFADTYSARKHDLAPDPRRFAQERFAALSPEEMLAAISTAIEERLTALRYEITPFEDQGT